MAKSAANLWPLPANERTRQRCQMSRILLGDTMAHYRVRFYPPFGVIIVLYMRNIILLGSTTKKRQCSNGFILGGAGGSIFGSFRGSGKKDVQSKERFQAWAGRLFSGAAP